MSLLLGSNDKAQGFVLLWGSFSGVADTEGVAVGCAHAAHGVVEDRGGYRVDTTRHRLGRLEYSLVRRWPDVGKVDGVDVVFRVAVVVVVTVGIRGVLMVRHRNVVECVAVNSRGSVLHLRRTGHGGR